jgi:hypothetical protein
MSAPPTEDTGSEQVIKAGSVLAGRIARTHGERQAVAWVHAAAVARYAAGAGLVTLRGGPAPDTIREALGDLAGLHPSLRVFGGISLQALQQPALGDLAGYLDGPLHGRPAGWRGGYLLGDLYQALSAEARKNRALCQTPAFVTELLLDLAWDPAYREHGPRLRVIDPACGTGHILVEALARAASRQRTGLGRDRERALPELTAPLERAAAALDTVHGADLDPYAAGCASLRLLGSARDLLRGERRDPSRADLAALPVNVAAADSLLDEDEPLLKRGGYHAVIANPPYVTCKDPAARQAIRERYRQVCSGNYSLAVPFEVLMHDLCVPGGWVARITANSFMKREFGKKLVEEYFPSVDLQWIIDTSGAYIPGHGTPTVILVSRRRPRSSDTVKTVLGKRGEPSRPGDPGRGTVWTAIADAVRARESRGRFREGAARAREDAGQAGREG